MAQARAYHRSWKNYLLDDRYQLNFTLFMVIITALLVTCLALFIKREVRKATTISISDVQGKVDEGMVSEEKARESIDTLESRRRLVSYLLVGMDFLLIMGLTVYGIRMTHKVAGPLHKVSLYFDKVRGGKFTPVYNLRKGDQLVGFYEQFKEAHEAMRKHQEADVARLRLLIDAAEKVSVGSPEFTQSLAELKALLKNKEASLA
jgi:nitrogen fixation/metabolism regulation signal transduction histidine kinase